MSWQNSFGFPLSDVARRRNLPALPIDRTGGANIGAKIQREVYVALMTLNAPAELLGVLESWGDYDDEETLAAVRHYNRTGSIFDS